MPPVLLQEAVLEIWWQRLIHTDFQEMGWGGMESEPNIRNKCINIFNFAGSSLLSLL